MFCMLEWSSGLVSHLWMEWAVFWNFDSTWNEGLIFHRLKSIIIIPFHHFHLYFNLLFCHLLLSHFLSLIFIPISHSIYSCHFFTQFSHCIFPLYFLSSFCSRYSLTLYFHSLSLFTHLSLLSLFSFFTFSLTCALHFLTYLHSLFFSLHLLSLLSLPTFFLYLFKSILFIVELNKP